MYGSYATRSRTHRSPSGTRSVLVIALLALGVLIGILGMRVSQPRVRAVDDVPPAAPAIDPHAPQAPPTDAPAPRRAPSSNRNG